MATVKELLAEMQGILAELEYSYSNRIKSYNSDMKNELHEISKRVDKIIEDVEIDFLEVSLHRIKQKFTGNKKRKRLRLTILLKIFSHR